MQASVQRIGAAGREPLALDSTRSGPTVTASTFACALQRSLLAGSVVRGCAPS